MEMRNALADDVVVRDEGAVRVHRVRYRHGQLLRYLEEGPDVRDRQVCKCFVMLAGDKQGMSMEEGPEIQESQMSLVGVDEMCLGLTGDDVTEDTHEVGR